MPIDVDLIGKNLGVDCDILFVRLYYRSNERYSFINDLDQRVDLFAPSIEADGRPEAHLVQFPFMASVLAELKSEKKKHVAQIKIGWISLLISLFGDNCFSVRWIRQLI